MEITINLKTVSTIVAIVAVIAVGVIAYEMGSSTAKSTGSLVIEDNVQAQEDTDGSLTLDTENSKSFMKRQ